MLGAEGSEQASPADVHYPRRPYPRRREKKEGIGSGAMLYSWGVAQTRLRKYLLPEQVLFVCVTENTEPVCMFQKVKEVEIDQQINGRDQGGQFKLTHTWHFQSQYQGNSVGKRILFSFLK